MGFPGTFDAARRRVHALAGAGAFFRPSPVASSGAPSGSRPTSPRITGTVRLAEGVAAGHQGDGLPVVHRHARKGFANVAT